MKKTLIAAMLVTATSLGILGLTVGDGFAGYERDHDSDEHQGYERQDDEGRPALGYGRNGGVGGTGYLADKDYGLYQKECGGCHMAYPPNMLPTLSWQAMMASLDDHFGDNAELGLETRAQIENFLGRHAAGQGPGTYSERMWRATRGMAPPSRITETDYFVGKHHEIPLKMVQDNPEVASFSRCEACHTRAGDGSFDEHEVRIAGYGRWDD